MASIISLPFTFNWDFKPCHPARTRYGTVWISKHQKGTIATGACLFLLLTDSVEVRIKNRHFYIYIKLKNI